MESQPHKYRLTQKNGIYIFYATTVGNEIKITIEKSNVPNSVHSHTFSVETWKTIGSVFQSINSAQEAVQWINNAMKVHKVKVVEQGSLINLIFAIVEDNKTRHFVQIPIPGNNQTAPAVSSNLGTPSFSTSSIAEIQPITQSVQQDYSQYQSQQYVPQTTITAPTATTTTTTTTNTTTYTKMNDRFNFNEFGIDPTQVVKTVVDFNNPEMAKSIDAEQKLRLSQVGKVTTQLPTTQTVTSQVQTQSFQQNYSEYQTPQYKTEPTIVLPTITEPTPAPVSVPTPAPASIPTPAPVSVSVPTPISVPEPTPITNTTTTNTATYTKMNDRFNFNEFGIDPSQVVKTVVNFYNPEMTKSIDAEQKLRLSQVGKVTTQLPTTQTVTSQVQTQSVQQNYSEYQTSQYKTKPTIVLPTITVPTPAPVSVSTPTPISVPTPAPVSVPTPAPVSISVSTPISVPEPTPITTTTTTNTATYTKMNDRFNFNEFGIDPSQVVKTVVNFYNPEMTKSINAEQKLRLSQVGKITTENYVPEDKVEIPYQVTENPVQEESANTTTATNFTFDRPYITPADNSTGNANY